MKQPLKPKAEDCCNSGCNPCIFDVYERQFQLYKSYVHTGGETDNVNENAISQLEYTNFSLVSIIHLSYQHRLLLFKQHSSETNKKTVFWSAGDHFLLKYSLETPFTRAYSPIKFLNDEQKCDYDFGVIIKKYDNGRMSNYLHDLEIGQVTQWRGPYGNYKVKPDKFNRIIMVAQGTAITTMFSVISQILNNEEIMIKIVLLYCCKDVDCILLRNELYNFKSYWNFDYALHISKVTDKLVRKYQEPIVTHRLNLKDIIKLKPFTDKDQFLLCGSDKFMKNYHELLLLEGVQDENIVSF